MNLVNSFAKSKATHVSPRDTEDVKYFIYLTGAYGKTAELAEEVRPKLTLFTV